MRTLGHKLLHDLASHRAQYLAIALVIAIGIAGQVATGGLLVSLMQARNDFYLHNRFADVFASVKRAPDSAAARVAEIPGIHGLEARVRTRGIIPDGRLAAPGSALLVSWPGPDGLNTVTL